MEGLNVKNINDEKIFNVIDPNGQGEVVNRIRPISISINQKAETMNDQTNSTINLAVYWNDTWKSILDLTFDESLRQEYGKLVEDLTKIQKDIDMKQYKDAETKTNDFLKYVANLSSKYTAIPEKEIVSRTKNDFVKIKADKNSVKVAISDKLLNFMLKKYAKVNNLDYTKSNECFSTSKFNCLANNYDIYYHSPEIFQKQAYMTVVKDNKVVGSYKINYDQFSKFAAKFMLTPQKLGYSKDRLAGYMKTAEVVMQNIFFDSVDEAKEWQEMVDEKKKMEAEEPAGEETTEIKETETKTKTEIGEGKSESPAKEEGGLARTDEGFASDEIPESEPRQQDQQGGGQNLGASRRINLLKKKALKKKAKVGWNAKPENEEEEIAVKIGDEIMEADFTCGEEIQEITTDNRLNPDNKEKNAAKLAELEEKRKKAVEDVVKKYIEEFKNEEIAQLVYEHLEDNNFHTANSIVEDFVDNNIVASKNKNVKKVAGKRLWVEVIYGKGKDDYWVTDMNPNVTDEEVRKYFTGHSFNIDHGFDEKGQPIEKFVRPYEVIIHREDDKQASKKVKLNKRANKEYVVTDEWQEKNSKGELVTENMEEELSAQGLINFAIERWNADYEEDFKEEDIKNVDVAKRFLEYIGFKVSKQANKNLKLNKKALYGDVQEQDIVPAKTETKVYLQSSDKDLDKVWGIKMFVDNIDNKDGMDVVEFTKIGLIDHINELIEEHDSEHDYGNEKLDYNCSDDLLKEYVTNYLNGTVEFIKESKINSNVQKKAEEQTVEEKIEEQVADDTVEDKIGVGDIVAINFDNVISSEDFPKYEEFIGKPLILMENDKEDINKVIVEQTEYPFQRITVDNKDVVMYEGIKNEEVIVEDTDGDEMITTFEELPVVAKQCKIKSIHKAARITKNKMKKNANTINYWNACEEVSFYGDELYIDNEWKKCSGKVIVSMHLYTDDVLGDGETHGRESYFVVDDYKIDFLLELEIYDEPDRKFTEEELEKILEENRDTFEYMGEMPSLTEEMGIKVNERD